MKDKENNIKQLHNLIKKYKSIVDYNEMMQIQEDIITLVDKVEQEINYIDPETNENALSLAINTSDFDLIELLIGYGAREVKIPLLIRALYNNFSNNLTDDKIISLLLKKGVNIDAPDSITGETPLLFILRNYQFDLAAKLIKQGAVIPKDLNLNICDNTTGNSLLWTAIRNDDLELIKKLSEHDVILNNIENASNRDWYRNTLKQYLYKFNKGFKDVIDALKEVKFNPNKGIEALTNLKGNDDIGAIKLFPFNLLDTLIKVGGPSFIAALNKEKNNINDFKKLFFELQVPHIFKHDNFLVTSQRNAWKDESNHFSNNKNIQEQTKTYFKDGQIFFQYNNKLVGNPTNDSDNLEQASLYALSKDGTLYISNDITIYHSFFLKSKPEKPFYGMGKPIVCGGHLLLKDGKIININNGSGHYIPTNDQLKLAVHYLWEKGVLHNDVKVKLYTHQDEVNEVTKKLTIEDIKQIDVNDILNNYKDLDHKQPLDPLYKIDDINMVAVIDFPPSDFL